MVFDHERGSPSQWAAMVSIARYPAVKRDTCMLLSFILVTTAVQLTPKGWTSPFPTSSGNPSCAVSGKEAGNPTLPVIDFDARKNLFTLSLHNEAWRSMRFTRPTEVTVSTVAPAASFTLRGIEAPMAVMLDVTPSDFDKLTRSASATIRYRDRIAARIRLAPARALIAPLKACARKRLAEGSYDAFK